MKPPGSRFGYDVLVYVGTAMFVRYRDAKEIKAELREREVKISEGEIFYLARKFVVYLSLAHRESQGEIKQLLDRNGGYILHLDATCEGDSPHLMVGMDGISEIVLENAKMASENAENIADMLSRIQAVYGNPIAVVHDMGKGICSAVSRVFPGIADFICHYHFLADVGRDLFGTSNDTIRKRLSTHGVQGKLRKRVRELNGMVRTNSSLIDSLVSGLDEQLPADEVMAHMPSVVCYTLVQWTLAAKNEGDGYGFPFDRRYLLFYQRLCILSSALKRLAGRVVTGQKKHHTPYLKVLKDLIDTTHDAVLRKAAREMEERVAVFDKLRKAMRIAIPATRYGLNDPGSNEKISTIEKRVTRFCRWLCNQKTLSHKQCYKNMNAQLDKYWDRLFCDPILITTPDGIRAVQPQRTNNIIERFFRSLKYIYRKRSGLHSLSRTMKSMVADLPFIKNLANPDYINIILNGKTSLEERFAEIDIHMVRKELDNLKCSTGKIPAKIKKLIQDPDLPEAMLELFAS